MQTQYIEIVNPNRDYDEEVIGYAKSSLAQGKYTIVWDDGRIEKYPNIHEFEDRLDVLEGSGLELW